MNQEETPATVIQLAAALAALGAYGGANTAAEHAAEAKRLDDSEEFYRMRLAYALLGARKSRRRSPRRPRGLRTGCRSPISRPWSARG